MTPVSSQRKKKQRGQALIEGALVAFAFTLAIIFVLEIGRYMLFIGYFTERARAGARYAAVVNYNADAIKNYIAYNSATMPASPTSTESSNSGSGSNSSGSGSSGSGSGTTVVPTGLFGLKPEMISVTRFDAGKETDRLTVSISNYPLSLFVPLLPAQWTLRPFKVTIPAESMGATT